MLHWHDWSLGDWVAAAIFSGVVLAGLGYSVAEGGLGQTAVHVLGSATIIAVPGVVVGLLATAVVKIWRRR